jgi:hypothetical protein
MNFVLLNPWMSANKLYFDLQFENMSIYLPNSISIVFPRRIWKEFDRGLIELLSRHLPGGTKQNHEKLHSK